MKKVIVITGVTGGVGKMLAKKFVKLKYNVIGLARNKYKLKKLKMKLGNNFTELSVDIRQSKDVLNAFKYIKYNFGRVDLVVNNAAIFKMNKFIDSTFDDIDSIIDTNLKGSMYLTLEAVNIMKENPNGGRIINIASVASIHGIQNQAIYCASKYGINGFAEALNQEIIKDGISISTIFPGGIDTPLWNSHTPYPGKNKNNLLKSKDIVKIVVYISKLKKRIVLKNLIMFPSNEWH